MFTHGWCLPCPTSKTWLAHNTTPTDAGVRDVAGTRRPGAPRGYPHGVALSGCEKAARLQRPGLKSLSLPSPPKPWRAPPSPLNRGARARADAGARRPGALMGYPHGIALRVAKATPPHAPGGQEPSRLSAWHCTHGSRGDCGGDWRPAAVGVDRHCTPTGCASLHRSSLTSLILSYSAERLPQGPRRCTPGVPIKRRGQSG